MTATLATLAVLLCSAASDPEAPPPRDDFSGYGAKHHLELSLGFLGGVRDESRAGYALDSGSAGLPPRSEGSSAPYERTIVYGAAGEVRYVARHLRLTAGLSKPFASFRLTDNTGEVGTRSLDLWDVRFGIGLEHSFRYAAPFIDVLGDAQLISAAVTVDGQTAVYRAWTFGFVVRAGVRVHLGDGLFLSPMGEVGVGGPVQWGVGLQAGWVLAIG